ncbi:hypothetical protein [Methylocystis parvus]|uniref:hypothetical protein n=1 Tax=Methylocystis parvus TaxID=134 RepID=UPI003C76A903
MKANARRLKKLEAGAEGGDEDDRDLPMFFIDTPVAQNFREYCIIRNSESCDPEVRRLQLIAELKEALTSARIIEHPRYDRIVANARRILQKLHREGDFP